VAARSRKSREASLARADGVVFNLNKILWNLITTPSAPKGGFAIFCGCRVHPSSKRRGKLRTTAFRQQPRGPCVLAAGETHHADEGVVVGAGVVFQKMLSDRDWGVAQDVEFTF
jgi:hypothetical protein